MNAPRIADLISRHDGLLPLTATLADAAALMLRDHGSSVIVVDAEGRAAGIVTEGDLLHALRRHLDMQQPLSAAMSTPVLSVAADTDFRQAYRTVTQHGLRHIVVADAAGRPLGVASESSIREHLGSDFFDHLCDVGAIMDRLFPRLPPDAPLAAALDAMAAARASCTVVIDGRRPLGILTARDVVRQCLTSADNPPLAAVMRQPVITIGEAASLATAAEAMAAHAIRHLIVVDGAGNATGLLSEHTLLRPLELDLVDALIDERLAGDAAGAGFGRDLARHKRAEEGMLLRHAALAGLARGEPIGGVLELIALSLESELAGWHCAVLLADAAGRNLHCAAAPSLPDSFPAAVAGQAVAAGDTPWTQAAGRRQRVVIPELATAPAHPAGYAACVAEPLLGPEGSLLGCFVAYHARPGPPHAEDLALLAQGGQLSALVIGHQRTAERLQGSRDTFRGIFDSVDEALLVLGEDRRLLDANRGAESLSGHAKRALVGHRYDEFGAPGLNDSARIEAAISAAFAGQPQLFEYWTQRADGCVFPGEVRLRPGSYFGRAVVLASVTDISERQSASLRLSIEHQLASTLAGGGERSALLAAIVDSGLRCREFDAGALYGRQPDGSYRLLSQAGLSAAFAAAAGEQAAGSQFASQAGGGKTVCDCQAACGQRPAERLLDSPALRAEGLRCLTLLPIVVDGGEAACLLLGGRQSTQISAATLGTLDRLRRTFGDALQRQAAQEDTRRQQQNLGGLFDTLDDFIFVVGRDGRLLHHNRAVSETLGYAPGTLPGRPLLDLHPDSARDDAARLLAAGADGRRNHAPLPLLCADGRPVMVDIRIVGGYWNGQPVSICVAQDISERLIAEERQKLAASVFDHAHEGIMITDPGGRIVEVNATFSELTGYPRAEAIGQTADLLKSGHHDAEFYVQMWRGIRDTGYWRGEVWNRKKSGEIFVELLTISTVRDRAGRISHFVGIFSDITLIKEHQQRLEHLAHFDALTQLPNRMLLADRMQLAMAQNARDGTVLAVCYLDLDGFKPVNDLYGHAVGDRLLIEVAQRLKTCVRAGDTVSRLGGDEFVLLFCGLGDIRESDHAIARVISTLTHPFAIAGHSIQISASIGVTLYPQDGADSDTLLRHADQAMYAAKQSGRNRFHLFDPEHDRRARARHEEIARIREGLANGEFALYYQPKVNMRKGDVIGAEALIRWQHPEQGLLLPGCFLPAIEGTDVAGELGDWVLRQALDQLAAWIADGLHLAVSVNIAGEHLQRPDFVERLGALLAAHPSVPPALLELEILETAALEDIAGVAELFAACRRLGVRFALDDFGTGYSSLTYFRRLPAEVLKIDQSFVRDMLDDPEDLAIVEGVIGLTQAFRRQVIAEGVESVEHGLVLLLLGCDEAQGFGIAQPMPAGQLPGWIGAFRPDELWNAATAFRWSRDDLPMLIAEVEHRRWKQALYAWLDGGDAHLPPPAGGERDCRFGRWYHGPLGQRYAGRDGFAELAPLHARIHALGRRLADERHLLDAAAQQALRAELEQASSEMALGLQQLQAEMLIAAQSTRR
ncbi:MAG TPA: EAL domain-containing protein [Azonexus sp.]